MLIQLRDYICREKIVSNEQLAREFRVSLSALEPMLELWIKKGVIAYFIKTASAQALPKSRANCVSSCNKCKMQAAVYYQYSLNKNA